MLHRKGKFEFGQPSLRGHVTERKTIRQFGAQHIGQHVPDHDGLFVPLWTGIHRGIISQHIGDDLKPVAVILKIHALEDGMEAMPGCDSGRKVDDIRQRRFRGRERHISLMLVFKGSGNNVIILRFRFAGAASIM